MTTEITYELVKERFNELRDLREGFITNFFVDSQTFDLWRKHNNLTLYTYNRSAVLLRQNEGFINLYFAATNIEHLAADLETIIDQKKTCPIVVDIVGRNTDVELLEKPLMQNGFAQYMALRRMSRQITQKEQEQEGVLYAQQKHATQIYDLLHNYFDTLAEQIPFLEQLENWATQKQILVKVIEAKVVGFLIFELIGVRSYCRYWFAHPDYRNQKIGTSLFKQFCFLSNNAKIQHIFVDQNNTNAIVRYKHYGFAEENMINKVLILR